MLLAQVARSDDETLGLRFAPLPERLERALEGVLTHYGTLRDGTADERLEAD
jgi:hypothetical protein